MYLTGQPTPTGVWVDMIATRLDTVTSLMCTDCWSLQGLVGNAKRQPNGNQA